MAKKIVTLNASVRLSSVIGQLESLLSALKKGQVFVQKGGSWVGLTPTGAVELDVEATQTKKKEGLRIEMCWRRPDQQTKVDEIDALFKILDAEPVIAASPAESSDDAGDKEEEESDDDSTEEDGDDENDDDEAKTNNGGPA